MFFDFECRQDTLRENDEYQHVPNLCVSDHVCNECITLEGNFDQFCANCEGKVNVFRAENCVERFIDFLDDFEDQRVVCIAHNLSGYDGMFILNELSKREFCPEPIMVGWKLYRLKYKNIVFLDSLLFIPMALSKMPEAFDLGDIQKGYYPHFFNTYENRNYIGPLPPKKMYGTRNFDEKSLKIFDRWYNEQVVKNHVFDNAQELIKYCKMDVNILKKGCIKYTKIFLENLGISPFLEATTLASTVMLGFRKTFLQQNTLGIVPVGGYSWKKKTLQQ